jgi:hypothetical protein
MLEKVLFFYKKKHVQEGEKLCTMTAVNCVLDPEILIVLTQEYLRPRRNVVSYPKSTLCTYVGENLYTCNNSYGKALILEMINSYENTGVKS